MKRLTMFQGLLILLLIGGIALGLRGRMSAIADGVPSISSTPSKAPVKPIPEAIAKLPPTIADIVRKDLSQQSGIPANNLQLVQSTPNTWSDGCLGLAKAGEMCSQAMVQGWQVVFANGSQRWTYRTDATGRVYRMEPTT